MTYGTEIEFPAVPTEQDLKELRRQVARDKFKVVDGGQPVPALKTERPRRRSVKPKK